MFPGEGGQKRTPLLAQRGSLQVAFMPKTKATAELVLPWHEPLPLSKSAYVRGWWFMRKEFSGKGFAAIHVAGRFSGFAHAVIAANATAARSAGVRPDASSIGLPTDAISRAPKAGWIIATGSAPIDAAVSSVA